MNFMRRALDLAEKAAGGVAPRPPVGAVIVAADGKTIVGEGATQPSPGPHAEAVAIAIARDAAKGGTIYCTLEPHQGHFTTPPCSQAIIDAGIKHVICPTVDPNPRVAGRGFDQLIKAGIKVTNNVDEPSDQRANELIEGFAKHIKTGMPFVTAKWAMSLDGKIATRTGDSKWITGPLARAHAHQLRYRSDAIITGIGTLIADNPRFTARDPNSGKRMHGRPYIRVIVDSQARMPDDAALLEEEGEVIQAIATPSPSRSEGDACKRSEHAGGARTLVITLPNCDNESVNLHALIRHLGERGCINVLVEAGGKLTGELFDLKLVDKVIAYMSTDKIIGGQTANSPIGGIGPAAMHNITRLNNTRIENLGDDIAIIGYVDYPQEND